MSAAPASGGAGIEPPLPSPGPPPSAEPGVPPLAGAPPVAGVPPLACAPPQPVAPLPPAPPPPGGGAGRELRRGRAGDPLAGGRAPAGGGGAAGALGARAAAPVPTVVGRAGLIAAATEQQDPAERAPEETNRETHEGFIPPPRLR